MLVLVLVVELVEAVVVLESWAWFRLLDVALPLFVSRARRCCVLRDVLAAGSLMCWCCWVAGGRKEEVVVVENRQGGR